MAGDGTRRGAAGPIGIGLDFGTTNSALAVAGADGVSRLARFPARPEPTTAFRSVLYFGREDEESPLESAAGPQAIERYLEAEGERRLMQSLKSFLGSRLFTATQVFGRQTTLEELITRILRQLLAEADPPTAPTEGAVVVGRPVRFARARDETDDAFAIERMERALKGAGIEHFVFEYEPVAAAYHYEHTLEHDELLLIADFGGGTSDFCLLPVGPSLRGRPRQASDILGTEGVGLAGDAFDARIVRHVIAPRLGRGTRHQVFMGRSVPVPAWIYADLERWHHLSFLRSPRTLALLREVRSGAEAPEKIDALLHVVERDLGYALHHAVELAKAELSRTPETRLRYADEGLQLEASLERSAFEGWIAPELEQIEQAVERLLEQTRTPAERVDRVFLTGGSSFVPAVRRIFGQRFGEARLRTGAELTSVASGLALRAAELARS